jgi:uncharacterized membrane protein
MADREWLLKRNCSITPRQLMQAYLALCIVSLAIAVFIALRGAWYVLGFSVLELGIVGGAFLYYARHATDRERIVLSGDWLQVELIEGGNVRRLTLPRRGVRLVPLSAQRELIRLQVVDTGVEVAVGRYLTARKRHELLLELHHELAPVLHPVNDSYK